MFVRGRKLFGGGTICQAKSIYSKTQQPTSTQFIRKRIPPSYCNKRFYTEGANSENADISWLKWLLTMKTLSPEERRERSIQVLSQAGTKGISDPEVKEHFDNMLKSKKANFYPSLLLHLWSETDHSAKLKFLFGHIFNAAHPPLMWELGSTIFESDPTIKNFCQAQAWFTMAHIRTLQDFMCTKLSDVVEEDEELAPNVAQIFLTAYQFSIASQIDSADNLDDYENAPLEVVDEARSKTQDLFPNLLKQIIKPSIDGNISISHPGWISSSLYPPSTWREKRKLALALHVSNSSSVKELASKDMSSLTSKPVDELIQAIESTFYYDSLEKPVESMGILLTKYLKWKEAVGE